MQKANGRQRQNSYRFKVRHRDLGLTELRKDNDNVNVNVSQAAVASGSGSSVENQDGTAIVVGDSPSSSLNSKSPVPGPSGSGSNSSTSSIPHRKPSRPFSKHDPPQLNNDYKKEGNLLAGTSKSFRSTNPGSRAGPSTSKTTANQFYTLPETNKTESSSTMQNDCVAENQNTVSNADSQQWHVQMSKSKHKKRLQLQGTQDQISTADRDSEIEVSRSKAKNKIVKLPEKDNSPNFNDTTPTPTSTSNNIETITDASTNMKKKNKKKPSKEDRRVKREEAALKELYKPKDSRVQILTPEIFQKMRGENQPTVSSASKGVFENFRFTPNDTSTSSAHVVSNILDFPALNTSIAPKSSGKSFAAAVVLSSPLPPTPISTSTTACLPTTSMWASESSTATPCLTVGQENIQSTAGQSQEALTSTGSVKKPKLSKRPITINLGDLIDARTPVRQSIAKKQIAKKSKHDNLSAIRENPRLTVGNLLDSSGPVVIHRGKIREKKHTPSKLKKCIIKSREDRKAILNDHDHDHDLGKPEPQGESIDTDDVIVIPSPDPQPVLKVEISLVDTVDSNTSSNSEIEIHQIATRISDIKTSEHSEKEFAKDDPEHPENEKENAFKSLLEQAEEASKSVPPIPSSVHDLVKLQMHSRKFRAYCDMFVSKELHGLVISLMKELHRLQDRIYKTDPIKLLTKRRYVNGIKEASNAVKYSKAQLVIMAPDIESNNLQGGLDEKIAEILVEAKEKNIPYIFSGNRFILGKCIMQTKSPVSVIVVLDKQSVEENFQKVLDMADQLRMDYQQDYERRIQEIMAK